MHFCAKLDVKAVLQPVVFMQLPVRQKHIHSILISLFLSTHHIKNVCNYFRKRAVLLLVFVFSFRKASVQGKKYIMDGLKTVYIRMQIAALSRDFIFLRIVGVV